MPTCIYIPSRNQKVDLDRRRYKSVASDVLGPPDRQNGVRQWLLTRSTPLGVGLWPRSSPQTIGASEPDRLGRVTPAAHPLGVVEQLAPLSVSCRQISHSVSIDCRGAVFTFWRRRGRPEIRLRRGRYSRRVGRAMVDRAPSSGQEARRARRWFCVL